MKKLFSIALMAALLIAVSAGCTKNEYGKWDTLVNMALTPSIPEERAENIRNCIKDVPYFIQEHLYEGYHDECLNKAANEFLDAAEQVDGETLSSNLNPGESVILTLIFRAQGASEGEMALQYYWRQKVAE